MDMNKIHLAFDTIDQQVKDITRSTSMTEEEEAYFLSMLAEQYGDLAGEGEVIGYLASSGLGSHVYFHGSHLNEEKVKSFFGPNIFITPLYGSPAKFCKPFSEGGGHLQQEDAEKLREAAVMAMAALPEEWTSKARKDDYIAAVCEAVARHAEGQRFLKGLTPAAPNLAHVKEFIARMEGTWENPTVVHVDAPVPEPKCASHPKTQDPGNAYDDITAHLAKAEALLGSVAGYVMDLKAYPLLCRIFQLPLHTSCGPAVAPAGVLDDAKIALHSLKCLVGSGDGDNAEAADYIKQVETALSRMTTLPNPSDWARSILTINSRGSLEVSSYITLQDAKAAALCLAAAAIETAEVAPAPPTN